MSESLRDDLHDLLYQASKVLNRMCLPSILMGFSVTLFATMIAIYIAIWKQQSQMDTLLELWTQVVQFWTIYITFNWSFPMCYEHFNQTDLVAFYMLIEVTGRCAVVFVNCLQESPKDKKIEQKGAKVFLKLMLVLYISLIFAFFCYGGCNVCTCLYLSGSLASGADIAIHLVNSDLQCCVESILNKLLMRKWKRLCREYELRESDVTSERYASDTIADLRSEFTALTRSNFIGFSNVLRITFETGSLVCAVHRYGLQPQVLLLSIHSLLRLMFHFVCFVTGVIDLHEVRASYAPLTDLELKPYLLHTLQARKKDPCTSFISAPSTPLRDATHHVKQHSTHVTAVQPKVPKKKIAASRCRKRGRVKFDCAHDAVVAGENRVHLDDDEDSVDICSICLSTQNIETVQLVVCGHRFHEGCLLCLLRLAGSDNSKARKCPLCRAPITTAMTTQQDDMAFLVAGM